MAEIPEHELEETRAALASTLEATAAILPWVSKPRQARFSRELNERWIASARCLAAAWAERHANGAEAVRPAIFALYAIALESADSSALRLGEALASAADSLETNAPSGRLLAAMTASLESLNEPEGLENPAFTERALHFAGRLEASCTADIDQRSPLLDRLFVDESAEQILLMREALAHLPPDAYALSTEAHKLAQQAELLELWGVMHLAREIVATVGRCASRLDDEPIRAGLDQMLDKLSAALAAIRV